jgi:hypothetical protein
MLCVQRCLCCRTQADDGLPIPDELQAIVRRALA